MGDWISVNDKVPKVGEKVILCLAGTVQHEIYMYDECDTNDFGGVTRFWSREDIDEGLDIRGDDFWMKIPPPPTI